MKLGLPISVVIHVAFIGGTALHWGTAKPRKDVFRVIPVEIVNVSDITRAPAPQRAAPDPAPDRTPPDTPPADEASPQIKPSEANLPETKPADKSLTPAEVKPDKTPPKDPPKAEAPKGLSFDDLENMAQSTASDYSEKGGGGTTQTQSEQNREEMQMASRDGELSTSYEDAVMRRVYNSWQIPTGAPDMEDLVVTVEVKLSRDGRVVSAQLSTDSAAKAGKDPFYKSAANSAVRAVNKAEKFEFLPYDQYNKWQTMTLTFYPKNAPAGIPT
ncbi:TonB C-terminal domain-containing protein [Robiginitomaculum antarcticum]|uniref:TonB C-terminal domain-containing protein n=1 Tax=Robiginitomaculum antarcticum TaxID=437507 RepID=UPI000360BD5D|nr:TonB C-terminal domain-containing protein [Robiginitomaculum antarcticum]